MNVEGRCDHRCNIQSSPPLVVEDLQEAEADMAQPPKDKKYDIN
jgi:hypothetical protein